MKNFRLFVAVVLLISVVMAFAGCSGVGGKHPVDSEHEDFESVIENAGSVKEIDPFAYAKIHTWGANGKGSVAAHSEITVFLGNDIGEISFDLSADTSKNGTLSNGDIVHVTLESDPEYYNQLFGLTLTRTEADIELNEFVDFAHKNPSDIIECFGGKSFDNAMAAINEFMVKDYVGRTAEYVGALYYYQDEGNKLNSSTNEYNQMVLIYHIDDGIVPDGWYTYIAPRNNVAIGYEDGEKVVLLDDGSTLEEHVMFYQREVYAEDAKYNHPIVFEHDGTTYVGHRTIDDCIEAYEKNVLQRDSRSYDHVIVSDGMPAYGTVG